MRIDNIGPITCSVPRDELAALMNERATRLLSRAAARRRTAAQITSEHRSLQSNLSSCNAVDPRAKLVSKAHGEENEAARLVFMAPRLDKETYLLDEDDLCRLVVAPDSTDPT